MSIARTHKAGIAGLLIVATVVLAYLPGLTGSFIFDDYPQVVHQPAIQVQSLNPEDITPVLMSFQHGIGRPIPMVSFAIDHVIWGMDPWGFKLTNLVIHVLNALLMFALARRLLVSNECNSLDKTWVPAILATIWATHPLQVSTVLYVVQRMESLSTFFILVALLFYLTGRRRQIAGKKAWPQLLLCIPAVGLGLASKETAALFPVYALCLELTVLRFEAHSAKTAKLLRLAYALALGACFLAMVALAPNLASETDYAIRPYSAVERVLTQFRVIPMYLGWILFPQPEQYVFYYDHYQHSQGILSPATTLAGAVLLILVATSAVILNRRLPLYSVGVAWFLSAHLITSSYLPLELVFEHRNYFATFGVILAAYALTKAVVPLADRRIVATTSCLVTSFILSMCLIRSATWGDPLHLALELAQNNPSSPRAATQLADTYLILAGQHDETFFSLAEAEYERASRLPNASPIPEQGLIVLAARRGLPPKPEWWESLLLKLQTQPIGPQEMNVVTSLLDLRQAGLAIDDGHVADAYIALSNRMALPPTQYFAFGVHALVALGDRQLSNDLFQLTIDHADGNAALLAEMAAYLREMGQPEAAAYIETRAALPASNPGSPR